MSLLHVSLAWSLIVAVLYHGYRTARKAPATRVPVVYGADNTYQL